MKLPRGFEKKEDLLERFVQSVEEKLGTPKEIDTGYRPQPKQQILHDCKGNAIL